MSLLARFSMCWNDLERLIMALRANPD
jgi:hypothetical protein